MKIDFSKLQNYELIFDEDLKDLSSDGYLLRHKKTGARVVLISNDDDNKVFYIGFRTTPNDSTGVMHIIEHSVLCGSKKYPLKDPFIELAKGSLNTFLNAMTYPDKTVYPVASCNDKDFKNLCNVYLDAVFYPNSINTDMTYKQEGWHYEMESLEDELKLNGVVYNEMKGAFSAPDDVLEREIFNSLFPDTTYGMESGGDPKNIPDLTYTQYVETYKKYYHPSNSYIYLYGDMDMIEYLDFIDKEYLSDFDYLEIDSSVETQKAFEEPKLIEKKYSITDSEPLQDNSYLSYNTAMQSNLDQEEYIALQIVDYALCSAPGAELKQALLDAKIGKDIYSYYDNGVKQPYFSIVSRNSNAEQKDDFVNLVNEKLAEIIEKGFDKNVLKAGLNALEFKFREADFGSYPPGLMYGLQVFDSWLYDDALPFIHICAGNTFKMLRDKLDTDYFEKLVEKYILSNTHKTYVVVTPEIGLADKEEENLKKKLADYKASLSEDELKKIVEDTHALKAYQEEEESLEALKCIPVLERSDIKRKIVEITNDLRDIDGVKLLYHPIDTRGIDYVRLVFDVTNISKECLPYLGIYKNIIGLVNTKNYSYSDLCSQINIETGGIAPVINVYGDNKNRDTSKVTFDWKSKIFKGDLDKAFKYIKEIVLNSDFSDTKRNYELIAELKSHLQGVLMNSGHQVASGRLASYFSKGAVYSDTISGLSFYKLVEKLEKNYDEEKDKLVLMLQKINEEIYTKANILIDFAGDESELDSLAVNVKDLLNEIPDTVIATEAFVPVPVVKNEGLMSSSMVNYVCRGGNFRDKGYEYTGAMRVLKVIMSYDYLWTNIRVKGGAYGCMCSFSRSGDMYFVSYRDPNLSKTVDVFNNIAEYIDKYTSNDRSMTQSIIGAISVLDTPLTPSAKALRSMVAYLTNITDEDFIKERNEVLDCTNEDIVKLTNIIKAAMEDEYICVVGNEEMIKNDKSLFDTTENIING